MSVTRIEYMYSPNKDWDYNYIVYHWNKYLKKCNITQFALKQENFDADQELDKFDESLKPIFDSVRYPNVQKTHFYIFPQQKIFIFEKSEDGKLSAGECKIQPFLFKQLEHDIMRLSKDQGVPSSDFVNKLLVGFY